MAESTTEAAVLHLPSQVTAQELAVSLLARRQAEADHVMSRLREHVLARPTQPVWLVDLVELARAARTEGDRRDALVQADVLACLRFLADANEVRVVIRDPDRRWIVSSSTGVQLSRHVRREWDALRRPLVRGDICVVRGVSR